MSFIDNSGRNKMGKKYLDTKEGSLEQSILGVWQTAIEEQDARVDGRTKQYKEHRAKLEAARLRREKKKLNKEEVKLQEKPADFIRLTFNSPADVKKAKKWMDQNLPGADQGFTFMDASGKDIDFENVDDAEDLMAKLKKAGFKFKVDYREEVEVDEAITSVKKWWSQSPEDLMSTVYHARGQVPPADKVAYTKSLKSIVKQLNKKYPAPKKELEKFMKRMKEEVKLEEGSKEEYQKFFNAAMKKFGIDSPADLKSDEEKKKFFDYVDKNYKGEKDEEVQKLRKELFGLEEGKMSDIDQMMKDGKSAEEIAKALKMDVKSVKKVMGESYEIGTDEYRKHTENVTPGEDGEWVDAVNKKNDSMREALAKVWGVSEGKSPFEKKSLTKEVKDGKTMTGKKIASVDINPTIKEKKK